MVWRPYSTFLFDKFTFHLSIFIHFRQESPFLPINTCGFVCLRRTKKRNNTKVSNHSRKDRSKSGKCTYYYIWPSIIPFAATHNKRFYITRIIILTIDCNKRNSRKENHYFFEHSQINHQINDINWVCTLTDVFTRTDITHYYCGDDWSDIPLWHKSPF